jgi:hypothetical protein
VNALFADAEKVGDLDEADRIARHGLHVRKGLTIGQELR